MKFASLAHGRDGRPIAVSGARGGADVGTGRSVDLGGDGYSCLAELRAVEEIANASVSTPFLRHGVRVEIDMLNAERSVFFGKIDQEVVHWESKP